MVVVLSEDELNEFLLLLGFLVQLVLLGYQRLEPVFDGVLISPVFEYFGYLGPLLALGLHVADENVVFPELPLVLALVGVQMVQPSFAALLGGPVELALRVNVEFLRQFAPLVFPLFVPL